MIKKKRRETPTQEIIRLLHKTHKEVHAILGIVATTDIDFSPEDQKVREMTKKIKAARQRVPPFPEPQTNPTTKGEPDASY